MTQTTFTDNVLVDGSQDIEQLRVEGHSTQTEPLQTWENSAGDVLAQITGDGRLIIGDDVTPDSLIEAHRLDTSTSKPKRGIHSLGQVAGTLATLVQWIVGELELKGSTAIDALHTALRIRASNLNTGTPTSNAELRGADIEVINDASAGSAALTKAIGLQVGVTNASGKTITDAIGLKVKMDNSGTITNPYSIYTEGSGAFHLEDYMEVKRPASVPGTPDTDFIRIYPKSDGKLYAKNASGTEFDLTGGSAVLDDPGINNVRLSISSSDPNPAPGSTGTTIYVHPFEGEQISLYDTDTEKFVPRAVTSPIALDMTSAGAYGGNQVPFMPQDVFLYWDAATSSIKGIVVPWASAPISKSVTNITNASPPVLTVGSSHGFAVNDLVVLQDVTGGAASLKDKMYRVIATTSTTVSLGQLDATNVAAPGGTSTNGTLYKISHQVSRTTGLGTFRGVKIKASDSNNPKYIGTVAYGEVKETIYDTLNRPFIVNKYNKINREVSTTELTNTTVNWTLNHDTNTPTNARAAGNRYQDRLWVLVGIDNDEGIDVNWTVGYFPAYVALTNGNIYTWIALDTIANYTFNSDSVSRITSYYGGLSGSTITYWDTPIHVPWQVSLVAGLHFLQPMEYAEPGVGANNWTGVKTVVSGAAVYKLGFTGKYPR